MWAAIGVANLMAVLYSYIVCLQTLSPTSLRMMKGRDRGKSVCRIVSMQTKARRRQYAVVLIQSHMKHCRSCIAVHVNVNLSVLAHSVGHICFSSCYAVAIVRVHKHVLKKCDIAYLFLLLRAARQGFSVARYWERLDQNVLASEPSSRQVHCLFESRTP
jgi:hypothetical protein